MKRESLSRRLDEMRRLLEAARDLAGELDPTHLLGQFSRHAAAAVGATEARVWLNPVLQQHQKGSLIPSGVLVKAEHLAYLQPVLAKGELLYFSRSASTPDLRNLFDEVDLTVKNGLLLPIPGELNRIIGVLAVFNKREGRFVKRDAEVLGQLIRYGGITLENALVYRRQQSKLQLQERILEIGRDLFRRLRSDTVNLPSLIKLTAHNTSELLKADRTTVFLIDEVNEELWSVVAEGLPGGGTVDNEIRIPVNSGLAGHTATTGETVNIADAYNDSRFNKDVDRRTGYKTKSVLVFPLRDHEGKVMGVVQVLNKEDGTFFTFEDEELLRVVSGYVSVALSNASMLVRNRRLVHRQQVILEAGQSIARMMPIGELITLLASLTSELLEADRSTVFICDKDTGELWSLVAEGTVEIRFPADKGIAGAVAQSGKPLNIPEAYDDERFNQNIDKQTGYRTKSILALPMFDKQGELMGVFQVLNKKSPTGRLEDSLPFNDEDETLLRMLAAQAAVSFENNHLYEQRREMFESLIETLAGAIDARDKITSNHTRNVTRYATALGREMGLDDNELEVLRVSAILHDIGKIGTPDKILCKPGRFTPDEFEVMKEHVTMTRDILSNIKFERLLRGVPDIAAGHHEKLDGSGYPRGLASKEIPLGARILAVADIFDALTQKRHYKDPMPIEKAFHILREEVEAGHLDGRCVEQLISWWQNLEEPLDLTPAE